MRKSFNITGSCNPHWHYMVDTEKRFDSVKKLIDHGEYFTINRARQYGKTTMLQTIQRRLSEQYLIIKISFDQIALSDSNARSYDTAEVVSSIKVGMSLTCDVNQDGNVDISDIVAVINTIADDKKYRATAEVNGDNSIDISDVVAIINYIAGKK